MSNSEEEEDILVYVDFKETVLPPAEGSSLKLIGLDSDSPIVQYQRQTFKGEWSESFGTKVLMTEAKSPEPLDPVFSQQIPKQYEYCLSTTKVLNLQQYVLNPKNEVKRKKNEADNNKADADKEAESKD